MPATSRLLTTLLLLGVVFATPVPPATAGVAPGACGSVLVKAADWLNGSGVDVKSNGSDEGTGRSCGGGSKWQCVELINRLYTAKGWIARHWSGNGGRSSATARDSLYDNAPTGLAKEANGSITFVGPGDVISINEFHDGSFVADGHALVVNTSGLVTSGGAIPLVSQNSGNSTSATPRRSAALDGGTMTMAGSTHWSYSVIGVVHAPRTQSPVGVTSPALRSDFTSDFDGDGTADVLNLRKDGVWQVSYSATSGYATVQTNTKPDPARVRVGDFDGDGHDDVLNLRKDGVWQVSYSATSRYATVQTNTKPDPARVFAG